MCVNWKFSKFIVDVARERENLKLFDGDRLNNIDKMPFTPGRVHILSFQRASFHFCFFQIPPLQEQVFVIPPRHL